jgi:UPF0755 protein
MTKQKTKRKTIGNKSRIVKWAAVILLVGLAFVGYWAYQRLFRSNVHIEEQEGRTFLYIRTGSSFKQVVDELDGSKYLQDTRSFCWMAEKMGYVNHVKPGKYLLTDGMTNRELIGMLRTGKQTPVKVIFHNVRFMSDLAADIAEQIEADSATLLKLLHDNTYLAKFGFDTKTVPAMFIPNTYELYWNTSAEQFLERMSKEYKKFWTDAREKKCEKIGLSRLEAATLASIIEQETQKNDEKRTIAGVYINRLHKGMLLQADPTVKYACGDFAIKRILKKHLEVNSPYNTYQNSGLPPGPICVPSIASVEAVLNYQHHDFLYFCAKEDFSGRHNFARTLEQHNRNARLYQKALNHSGIWR